MENDKALFSKREVIRIKEIDQALKELNSNLRVDGNVLTYARPFISRKGIIRWYPGISNKSKKDEFKSYKNNNRYLKDYKDYYLQFDINVKDNPKIPLSKDPEEHYYFPYTIKELLDELDICFNKKLKFHSNESLELLEKKQKEDELRRREIDAAEREERNEELSKLRASEEKTTPENKQIANKITADELDKELSDSDTGILTDYKRGKDKKVFDTDENKQVQTKCAVDDSHKTGKIGLQRILQAIRDKIKLCDICSNSNVEKASVSQFERDLVQELRKKLPKIIPGFNGVIKYGEGGTEKEDSGLKSVGGRKLDYDICFELPRPINGYKKVAVNLDGPSHNAAITYWETRQNDFMRIEKGSPEVFFIPISISYSKNDKPYSKETKVYNFIVGKILHLIRSGLLETTAKQEASAEERLKQKYNYYHATEEEKKRIDNLIHSEKSRVRAGLEDQRDLAQDFGTRNSIAKIKNALLTLKQTNGPKTLDYIKKDKHGYNTSEIGKLDKFLDDENTGEKSLRKNLIAWSEVTKPDFDVRRLKTWMADHQANQGQINYDAKTYPIQIKNKKAIVKLFEEITKKEP